MSNDDHGDEDYQLLADEEGPEAAQAAVAHVRQQRRRAGKPAMARMEAVRRADAHLRAQGSSYVVDATSARADGPRDRWILGYHDPRHPDETLDGGDLVVTASGEVRHLSSAPDQVETVGVVRAEDGDEAWRLPGEWETVLAEELSTPRWSRLGQFVAAERRRGTVYPPPAQVFHAFELTSYSDVRVVIVGQDPYHGAGQAHGLCFSVAQGATPPSLRRILAELRDDLGCIPTDGGNLESWARQGVLLLNTVLTVRAGQANSHRGQGWEEFSDAVVRAVIAKPEPVVFLLWGAAARKKGRWVANPRHKIITAAHPAARPNAHQPFTGSRPFSRANKALSGTPDSPITWGRKV